MRYFVIVITTIIAFFAISSLIDSYSGGPKKTAYIDPYVSPTPVVLSSEKLWEIIQNWRTSQNLPKYVKDIRLCTIATSRLPEIPQENVPHERFLERFHSSPYKIGENVTGAISESDALNKWLASPPHRKALESSWKYSCTKCEKDYCVQIFSNF